MSFKIHLVIIALIVGVVYFIWQTFQKMPEQVVMPAQAVKSSLYSIAITHASWGMSCKNHYNYSGTSAPDAAYKDTGDKLREDNALSKVSEICNGKVSCNFPVSPEALGEDPAPSCAGKSLQVEYRCFSYDRPWNIETATGGVVTINCDRSN